MNIWIQSSILSSMLTPKTWPLHFVELWTQTQICINRMLGHSNTLTEHFGEHVFDPAPCFVCFDILVGNVLGTRPYGWQCFASWSLWLTMAWTLFTVVGNGLDLVHCSWQMAMFWLCSRQAPAGRALFTLSADILYDVHTICMALSSHKEFCKTQWSAQRETFFAYRGGWNLMKF